MDIVRSLPTTEDGHIVTIQDLLTKYSVTMPFKQTTSSEVAEALVKKFINPYTAPKTWITDQGSNFISSVMQRHTAHKYKISTYKIPYKMSVLDISISVKRIDKTLPSRINNI